MKSGERFLGPAAGLHLDLFLFPELLGVKRQSLNLLTSARFSGISSECVKRGLGGVVGRLDFFSHGFFFGRSSIIGFGVRFY